MRTLVIASFVVLATLVPAAGAQTVARHASPMPGPPSDAPLRWAQLEAFHADLAERAAADAGLADARATLARLFAENRDFSALSPREQDDLVAAHNAIVAALALGPTRQLACDKVAAVGSHRKEVQCMLTDMNARERLQRLEANARQTL
jgi:hypothetical protein